VAVGVTTGAAIGVGTFNTFVGASSNATGDYTNATAIGARASVASSNTIQLGDGSVTLVNTNGSVTSNGLNATAGNIQTSGSVKAGTLNGAAAAPLTQGALNASVAITKFAGNVSLFVGSTSVTLTGSATLIDPNAVVMIVVKNTTPTNFTAYVANTASGTTTVNLSGAADANTTISYIIVNP
jgi:hypothetical protein